MRFLRQNAIAMIALAVALSGTAYAANRIGPRDIARNAVRSVHIAPNQVRSADLNRRVRRQIAVALHRRGPQGPAGPQGKQGPQGPEGNFGNVEIVNGPKVLLGADGSGDDVKLAEADCPSGTTLVGGGYSGGTIDMTVSYDAPAGNSWGVIAINWSSSASNDFQAHAICAS